MKTIGNTRKKFMNPRPAVTVPALLLLAASLCWSCIDDDDNTNATLRADFAMLQTNSSSLTVGFLTDDDVFKSFSEPKDISGARPDTTYRALVYYYETEQSSYVDLYGFTLVTVRAPQDEEKFDEIKTDPVGLQSIWLSDNNSYINMTLTVMTGVSGEAVEDTQTLDIVRSTDEEHGGITKLTLYHDQNDVPEYYSTTVYLSIPIEGYFEVGEPINLVVNTYSSGEVSNIFTITEASTSSAGAE